MAHDSQVIESDVADVSDVPLDVPVAISSAAYMRILRRIKVLPDGGTPVSAFNSSI